MQLSNHTDTMPAMTMSRDNSVSSTDSDCSPITPTNYPALDRISFPADEGGLVFALDQRLQQLLKGIATEFKGVAKVNGDCNAPPSSPIDGHLCFFPVAIEVLQERLAAVGNTQVTFECPSFNDPHAEFCTLHPNTPVDGHCCFFPIFAEALKERLHGVADKQVRVNTDINDTMVAHKELQSSDVEKKSEYEDIIFTLKCSALLYAPVLLHLLSKCF